MLTGEETTSSVSPSRLLSSLRTNLTLLPVRLVASGRPCAGSSNSCPKTPGSNAVYTTSSSGCYRLRTSGAQRSTRSAGRRHPVRCFALLCPLRLCVRADQCARARTCADLEAFVHEVLRVGQTVRASGRLGKLAFLCPRTPPSINSTRSDLTVFPTSPRQPPATPPSSTPSPLSRSSSPRAPTRSASSASHASPPPRIQNSVGSGPKRKLKHSSPSGGSPDRRGLSTLTLAPVCHSPSDHGPVSGQRWR